MSFSMIAAIGRRRELGKEGKLLFRLPEDLKFFKDTTMGHKIMMGRKTWESLPGKLPGREHYVVTRHPEDLPEGVTGVDDLQKFIAEWKGAPEEIFVIGGGMLYWEMLKDADTLYLTEVEAEAEADTFFPEFAKEDFSREVLRTGEENGVKYSMVKYVRKEQRE